MYNIIIWKWAQPNAREVYTSEHVNTFCRMIARNLVGVRYRIICVTDDPKGIDRCETFPLWGDCDGLPNATNPRLPSCYRRLKIYDPDQQRALLIQNGQRIVSIDLDTLVTGQLGPLLKRSERFVGWALPGAHHPKVFNGSFQMFTAGDLAEIWRDFNPNVSPAEAYEARFLGSDQSWLSYRLVNKPGCDGLIYPEVASYPNHVRQLAVLKKETKIIFFHGTRKPWHPTTRRQTPWVDRYWR
jgi:hypothetical protein